MRSQFIRLLTSIIAITLVIIAMQCLIIVTFNSNLKESWTEEVFDEFADSLSIAVSNLDFSQNTSDGIIDLLVNKTNERISGIIIRDSEGRFALSLGVSPQSVPVPQLSIISETSQYKQFTHSKMRVSANSEINPRSVYIEIDKPKYELAITSDASIFFGSSNVTSIDFHPINSNNETDIVAYPSLLDENDVAGTILVSVNGKPSAYMDVLVYDIDIYNPTKFVMGELFRCFIITLPIAVALSILMAYIISKRTDRVISGFKDSLSKLSRGVYDITLPESKVEEHVEISKSIKMLGEDLDRHSKSRKEWIRNISHDLNTPVTSMNLLLDGAIDGFFPIDKALIENLKKENDTLKERIASVSYYSYLLSPSVNCLSKEEPLFDIVDEVLQLGSHSARVEFNPETVIYCDHSIAKRALEEVVKNADMYKTGDAEPIIRCISGENSLVIKVLNEGKLPDPLPLFFEPWARGDDSRTSGGSGLGLSIAYQVMELHYGSISISEEDGMVAVTLEFPNKPAELY